MSSDVAQGHSSVAYMKGIVQHPLPSIKNTGIFSKFVPGHSTASIAFYQKYPSIKNTGIFSKFVPVCTFAIGSVLVFSFSSISIQNLTAGQCSHSPYVSCRSFFETVSTALVPLLPNTWTSSGKWALPSWKSSSKWTPHNPLSSFSITCLHCAHVKRPFTEHKSQRLHHRIIDLGYGIAT